MYRRDVHLARSSKFPGTGRTTQPRRPVPATGLPLPGASYGEPLDHPKIDRTGGGVLKHCAGWPMRLKRLGQKPGPGCFGSQRITMSSRSVPNRVCDATSPSTMRRAPASGGFGPARASRDGEDDLSDRQRVRNPDPEKTPRCLLAGHHGRAIPADEQPIWTPARRSRHHVLVETGVSVAHPRAG